MNTKMVVLKESMLKCAQRSVAGVAVQTESGGGGDLVTSPMYSSTSSEIKTFAA